MGLYTIVTSTALPFMIKLILNICILIYIRKSFQRVHTQSMANETSNANHSQKQSNRISRRDISLLKQMIFIFVVFLVGWTPALIVNTITTVSDVDDIIMGVCIYLSVICPLCLMINLFYLNHDVRHYIANKFRRCIR